MKKPTAVTALAITAALLSSCSGKDATWCTLEWPNTDKQALAGECLFEDKNGAGEDTSISFYNQDYRFIFPNSNKDKNYKRQDTPYTTTFDHNGYVLTIYKAGRPENS